VEAPDRVARAPDLEEVEDQLVDLGAQPATWAAGSAWSAATIACTRRATAVSVAGAARPGRSSARAS
jgi:hypothetical protein